MEVTCAKLHPDIPKGYTREKCFHGRMGLREFCVMLCVSDRKWPDVGKYIIYAPVADPYGDFSMVCMVDTPEDLQEAIFYGYTEQLRWGSRPLAYNLMMRRSQILGFERTTEEVNKELVKYAERDPETYIDNLVIFGRTHSEKVGMN